ncbi:tetraspanin 6 [Homalodisca vitripennis]|nr:tetraspanin 6 [Homalodisca vitripennis]
MNTCHNGSALTDQPQRTDQKPTLSGLAIILVGALVLTEVGSYSHFLENKVLAPPIVLIIAGSIVFFIAFLGCCGAIKENYYMLIGYVGPRIWPSLVVYVDKDTRLGCMPRSPTISNKDCSNRHAIPATPL